MPNRLLTAALLLLTLAGCAPDAAQIALCRSILPGLLAPDAAPREMAADAATDGGHAVELRYLLGRSPVEHRLVCRFEGGAWSGDRLTLSAVVRDGRPLSPVRMALLWRAYHLTPPADLVARAPAVAPPAGSARVAYFLQQLVNGATLGAVLALIAVGYSLVYGITGSIQFAFGEIFMIGAYLLTILMAALGVAGAAPGAALLVAAAAVPLALAVTGLYGWGIERLVYRPLRHAVGLAPLVAAIGLSIALREYVRLVQGARDKWLPALLPGRLPLFDGDGFTASISRVQLVILAIAMIVAVALLWLMRRSAYGRDYRACADDPAMAALLGVDVDSRVAGTFALGGSLAALAGLAVALYYGEVDFSMGYFAGFKALTAALLGGFGSLGGALLGGLLLGLFEAFWSGYVDIGYKDAAIFVILILVLVFRPQGLLGWESRARRPI